MKLRCSFLITTLLPLTLRASAPDTISTYAGGGPNNVPATQANVPYPVNTAVDTAGNFYFVIAGAGGNGVSAHRVYKVTTSGTVTIVAGNGFSGYAGDGGQATQAQLYYPNAAAVDRSGNVFIADFGNCIVRKVTTSSGVISTFAGTPQSCGYGGDGGAATSAQLSVPAGVALDSSGNVYIADYTNQRIRKVTASTGIISTIAGNGTAGYSGDGGPATSAELNYPTSVAVDGSGNVYIADQTNYRIRKVTASTGKISTIAGTGTSGFSGDGGLATSAEISDVYGVASDSSGRVFIADYDNCVVREVNTSGIINTVAGNHSLGCSFSGDGGAAASAMLNEPLGVSVDSSDNMYIADYQNLRIRKAALGGSINTVAGNGLPSYAAGVTTTGATLSPPVGATSDASGNVYIADTYNCIVRKAAAATGDISTIAGTPPRYGVNNCGYSGDGGLATGAQLNNPSKAIADFSGNVYIADTNNCVVRKVTASTGHISTFAGSQNLGCGYSGDGGPATSARLNLPTGLALDGSGNLYIADNQNQVIREVTAATGKITTLAGNNAKGAGYSGDGGPATNGQLSHPTDVAIDALDNLYIADASNYRVRMVNPNGIITTVAGNGVAAYSGDGVPANETSLYYPASVAVDAAGDLLIADQNNQRVRWVDGQGIIYTVAGNGTYGFSGDGGAATSAELATPGGVGVGASGNIYIADTGNFRIREVTAIVNLGSSAYSLNFPQQSVGTTSGPQEITLTAVGGVTINSITTTGDFTEADDCPGSLTSGANCNVDITFTPSGAGTRTGTLVIGTNGFFNPTIAINLKGTGEGLMYAPASLNFGNQAVGVASSARTITFTNDSTTSVTFSSVTTTRTTFTVASNTCTGSLTAGKTCKIGVTFKPSGTGTETATLVVKDSDSSSPQLIPLRGTGVTPAMR
ncbi:MAG: choice-of-anchor D domain-containing protein [Acidobacteriaceae bacterium]|nr:choice-of-anchor D domain-containing protein [Acidobacteriaceae bacterium]MBV9778538.1 choice-of-anchor D domain-containing protein [Acidobacteriaceae bacterium]